MTTGCRICGNVKANQRHYPREMMFGTGEEFEYLECGSCGCLQLETVPADLSRYYPPDYYAHQAPRERRYPAAILRLRTFRTRALLGEHNLLGKLLACLSKRPERLEWLRHAGVTLDSTILEVGCGTGGLLARLRRDGFRNVVGVDPFIERSVAGDGFTVHKKSVSELDQEFDLVMLHHAFEHMPDPQATMESLRRLVRAEGVLLLRIPLACSFARRKYGLQWVAWDAPRHLFLHTVKSVHVLAGATGFRVEDVVYDSIGFQFWGSELYLRGIPLQEHPAYQPGGERAAFTWDEWARFERLATELNARRDGDAACFYLRRADGAPTLARGLGPKVLAST